MTKLTKTILWTVIILVIIGGIWYGVSKKPVTTEKETIKIGFIGSLTGDGAAYGDTQLNSINLALKEINNQRRQKIEIIAEDGKCNGKDAATATHKLIDVDEVRIILGFTCSAELLASVPITEPKEVIVLSSFASNPQISEIGDFIFRNCLTDIDWAPYAAETIYKDNYRKLAFLSEKTEFAIGAKNIIKDRFIEKGGNIVSDETFEQNIKDYRTQITKIKKSNPDVIFLLPQSGLSAGLAVKQIKEMGLTIPIYSTYVCISEDALKIAGESLEGVYFFGAPVLNEDNIKAITFLNKYKSEYGLPAHDFLAVLSYDIAYIINEALENCVENTECIKDYLYSMKNYDGTAGAYSFNEKGDVVGMNFAKKQIINGEAQLIE